MMKLINRFISSFRGAALLSSLALLATACTSTKPEPEPAPDPGLVHNSLNDLSKRPIWTIDGRFQEFQREQLTSQETQDHLYKVGYYVASDRKNLDLCYQFARMKVETEIRQNIGQAVSTILSEAIDAGSIVEGDVVRVQNMTSVSAAKGAIAGLEVSERYWQEMRSGEQDKTLFECYVLARMPRQVYQRQLNSSIARLTDMSESTKAQLQKQTEDVDSIIERTWE